MTSNIDQVEDGVDGESAARKLAEDLEAAYVQCRFMDPWADDRDFVTNGGRVLYAVDVDVVKLFTDPSTMAIPTETRRAGYSQIFPDDPPERSVAIGRRLADHIFNDLALEQGGAMLMIPPATEELRGVFQAVARNAGNEQADAEAELKRVSESTLLQDLEDANSNKALLEKLLDSESTIANLRRGDRGPSAELRRFADLVRQSRVAPPEYFIEQRLIDDDSVLTALAPPVKLLEVLIVREYATEWERRIKVEKPSRGAERQLSKNKNDADVLARLQWINERLPDKVRMVLITGDAGLRAAAKKYRLDGDPKSFADLHLRHPRAYLAEPGVLGPDLSGTSALTDSTPFEEWIETFVGHADGEFKERDEVDEKELLRASGKLLEVRPDLGRQFRAHWAQYTSRFVVASGLMRLESIDNKEGGSNERLFDLIERVREDLEQQVRATWDAVFNTVIETGYGILFFEHGSDRITAAPRNAPVLVFDEYRRAGNFVSTLHAWTEQAGGDVSKFAYLLENLRREDNEESARGYLHNTAYALLFAAEGSWGVSIIIARRARTIAARLQEEGHTIISGREAAYLLAVALRHTARHLKDLDEAAEALDAARDCLALEANLETPSTYQREAKLRIEAEEVAVDLSRYLFQRFVGQPDTIKELVPALREIGGRLTRLVERAQAAENVSIALIDTRRKLLTNRVMVSLIAEVDTGAEDRFYEMEALAEAFESSLVETTESGEKVKTSFLIDVMAQFVRLRASGNPSVRRKARSFLQQKLSEESIRRNIVMAYDGPRFTFLAGLIDSP